jgi:hypothetical protein
MIRGRILVGGWAYEHVQSGDPDWGLARFKNDGTLDPAFSGDGRAAYDLYASTDTESRGMARHGDGKVVVSGPLAGGFGVAIIEVLAPHSCLSFAVRGSLAARVSIDHRSLGLTRGWTRQKGHQTRTTVNDPLLAR